MAGSDRINTSMKVLHSNSFGLRRCETESSGEQLGAAGGWDDMVHSLWGSLKLPAHLGMEGFHLVWDLV